MGDSTQAKLWSHNHETSLFHLQDFTCLLWVSSISIIISIIISFLHVFNALTITISDTYAII